MGCEVGKAAGIILGKVDMGATWTGSEASAAL